MKCTIREINYSGGARLCVPGRCVLQDQAAKGVLAVRTWHISTLPTRNFLRITPKIKNVWLKKDVCITQKVLN